VNASSHGQIRIADMKILDGIRRVLPPNMVLHLGGRTVTAEALAGFIEGKIQANDRRWSSYFQWLDAVERSHSVDRDARDVVRDLRTLIFAMFGPRSPQAEAFGFEPPKSPKKPTVEARVAANTKRQATRRANAQARKAGGAT
jgi:hypothetical protein